MIHWLNRRYAAYCFAAVILIATTYIVMGHRQKEKDAADVTSQAPVAVDLAQASIHPMDTVVNAQGTLISAQGKSARIAAVSSGRLLAVRAREGDRVVAGEVVAILDGSIQQAQARSAESAFRASRVQADQANQVVRSTALEHATAVKVARLELQVSETELRKLRRGARPQEIAQGVQGVNQSQATYERAATESDRIKFLYEKGIVAKRQLDDAQTALSVAKSALETAKAQVSLLREGAHPDDLHAAELRVETARANLQQAERGSLSVLEKQKEAQAAMESVNQKNADLSAARTAASYSELRSPISGIVTRRLLNPGDMADTSTPVLEIADIKSLNISAAVPADEGSSIRVGMPVRVSVSGPSASSILGRVLDTGQIDPQSGLLSVRISVPNPGGILKVGAFANAAIVVRTNPHAVVVPKEAVISRDGKSIVFIAGADGVAHQKEVETGVEESGLIEITSGVRPGESVIRLGEYELTDGTKICPGHHSGAAE
jgi:RND family efflux transporter MFP subunit